MLKTDHKLENVKKVDLNFTKGIRKMIRIEGRDSLLLACDDKRIYTYSCEEERIINSTIFEGHSEDITDMIYLAGKGKFLTRFVYKFL